MPVCIPVCVYKGFITSPQVFIAVYYVSSTGVRGILALSELLGVTQLQNRVMSNTVGKCISVLENR